jgi:pimeloyl-ACP methyl ester carboxylesterase
LESDTTVERAVIVVHGTNRDADNYFETMLAAVNLAHLGEETLVIAPEFQTADDHPAAGEAVWTSGGWKRGHLSVSRAGVGTRVSSYGAVDAILALLADSLSFPNLESVVVTGHSAGGQYTHRFAATSPAGEEAVHLRFRYIVANPSTYLYLGPERADGDSFSVPDPGACPDYNEWHYGLEDRNTYASALTAEELRDHLLGRDVVYLVGTADVGTNLLDMSCGAMLQGPNRYQRGLILFSYLDAFFPGHGHSLFQLPGVGHSSRSVYTSPYGQQALFTW